MSPDDARELLRRLLWFNLVWGWSAQGGIFVIPLGYYNYVAQRRSVNSQELTNLLTNAKSGNQNCESWNTSANRLSPARQLLICSICAFGCIIAGVIAIIAYGHDATKTAAMWTTVSCLLGLTWWMYAIRS